MNRKISVVHRIITPKNEPNVLDGLWLRVVLVGVGFEELPLL